MAIYVPGQRDKHNRPKKNGKRSAVAMLSLTAMVDMFTVLAVFLLQNYQTTGEVIELSDDVILPKAQAVKELKPAHVIMVSAKGVSFDKVPILGMEEIKAATDWKIPKLVDAISARFAQLEATQNQPGINQLRNAVGQVKPNAKPPDPSDLRRITVQADKSIDFLTVKKVMYTLYESGATEINFAVEKNDVKKKTQ